MRRGNNVQTVPLVTGIGRRTNANPFLGVRGGIAGLVGFAMDF
jgi:hypothetical protein